MWSSCAMGERAARHGGMALPAVGYDGWADFSCSSMHPQPVVQLPPSCRRSYVANSEMCQFPLVAAELAEAGLSSFRFDHACAIRSRSERQGPFLMGNHEDEARMRGWGWHREGQAARFMSRG